VLKVVAVAVVVGVSGAVIFVVSVEVVLSEAVLVVV
jgi:hypothetical protein